MTHWKRYAAFLIALSVPALAGCGNSQSTTPGSGTQAAPPSAAQQATQAQAAQERNQATSATMQASQEQSRKAVEAAMQNKPK